MERIDGTEKARAMFKNKYPAEIRQQVCQQLRYVIRTLEPYTELKERSSDFVASETPRFLKVMLSPMKIEVEAGTLLGMIYLKLDTEPGIIQSIRDNELPDWLKEIYVCQSLAKVLINVLR